MTKRGTENCPQVDAFGKNPEPETLNLKQRTISLFLIPVYYYVYAFIKTI